MGGALFWLPSPPPRLLVPLRDLPALPSIRHTEWLWWFATEGPSGPGPDGCGRPQAGGSPRSRWASSWGARADQEPGGWGSGAQTEGAGSWAPGPEGSGHLGGWQEDGTLGTHRAATAGAARGDDRTRPAGPTPGTSSPQAAAYCCHGVHVGTVPAMARSRLPPRLPWEITRDGIGASSSLRPRGTATAPRPGEGHSATSASGPAAAAAGTGNGTSGFPVLGKRSRCLFLSSWSFFVSIVLPTLAPSSGRPMPSACPCRAPHRVHAEPPGPPLRPPQPQARPRQVQPWSLQPTHKGST